MSGQGGGYIDVLKWNCYRDENERSILHMPHSVALGITAYDDIGIIP